MAWGGHFGTHTRELQMPWGPAYCDSDAVWEEARRCLLAMCEHSDKDEPEGVEWIYVANPAQYTGKLRLGLEEYDAQGIRDKGEGEINQYLADQARQKEPGALQAMFADAADAGQAILISYVMR